MTDMNAAGEIIGNFDMGNCLCDVRCVHGHEVRIFNIGRSHYAACDICKSFVLLGENLKSDWRMENKDIWEANFRRIKGYQFFE